MNSILKKKPMKIQPEFLLTAHILIELFKCLQLGNVESKSKNLTYIIILLKPFFIKIKKSLFGIQNFMYIIFIINATNLRLFHCYLKKLMTVNFTNIIKIYIAKTKISNVSYTLQKYTLLIMSVNGEKDPYNELLIEVKRLENELDISKKKICELENLIIEIKNKHNKTLFNKETRIEKRKLNESLKSKKERAVMPEDFPAIMRVVDGIKDPFKRAKFRLLHIFLKITGTFISNVKYLDFYQLENMFEKRTFYLPVIHNRFDMKLPFPYVKSREIYLEYGRKDFGYLLECKNMNDPRLYKKNNNNNENLLSELWSKDDRSRLNKECNSQLRNAAKFIKEQKILTSLSYRRGFGMIAIVKVGPRFTKYIMGLSYKESVDLYSTKYPDLKSLILGLEKVLDVKHSKELKLTNLNLEEQNIIFEAE